jgi:hypothetical protein
MIKITDLLEKINLVEALQVIKHLEHHGEKLYTGNPQATVEHLKAMHDLFSGRRRNDHNLSYKVDGSVSIVFGKHGGRSFVKYKGEGSPHLYSHQEIEDYTKEKPYLTQPFKVGLEAAQHPNIGENTGYQADVALESSPETFKGNLISYKKPSKKIKNAVAVHTEFNTETGEKTAANPNVSFLNTSTGHFPHLSLNHLKFDSTPEELKNLMDHISGTEELLKDKKVAKVAKEIATHVDPTNKTGHRHLIFKQFSNAVQRGDVKERSLDSLKSWMETKIDSAKGKDKERIQGHLDYVNKNSIAIQSLLKAHDHSDSARNIVVDILHRSGQLPMTPEGGHSQGEGFVSELKGFGQVKFVPQSFTVANVAQKEKFKKAAQIKEEMASGGGAISGIGFSSEGKPDQSEVKVSKQAQMNYTQANASIQPLYNYRPQVSSSNPRRRLLVMNMLNRLRSQNGM